MRGRSAGRGRCWRPRPQHLATTNSVVSGTHISQLRPICSPSLCLRRLHLYHYGYHQSSSKQYSECKHVRISTTFVISLGGVEVVLGQKNLLSMVGLRGSTFHCLLIHIFSGIELCTPTRRKLLVAKQYQIQFSVDDTQRSTKPAKEKKNRIISWNDVLYL